MRGFAEDLGLSVHGQYTSYVEWPGDRIVTTVVATRPGEIEPHDFRFPIVGRVPYKGFFALERAEREARQLRSEGFDVCLLPIPAYSTLGWWNDPVTTPMLKTDPGRVVETVLHELVHATVFVESQPDFNEGLATFVGQEAAIRFQDDPVPERERVTQDRALATFLLAFRDRVAGLYASEPAGPERQRHRQALEAAARAELDASPFGTRDATPLADRIDWNDACLALRGTYHADLPLHTARLEALGGDLRALLDAARQAANEEDPRNAFFGSP